MSVRKHYKELLVHPDYVNKIGIYCSTPSGRDACGRDECVFDHEVAFDNGMRMAIQVVAPNDPDTEPCWTQGVLLSPEGYELGCTNPGESFEGEYFVEHNAEEYVGSVRRDLSGIST